MKMIKTTLALFATFMCAIGSYAQGAPEPLIANTGFETDADADGWPDSWSTMKSNGSWEKEDGNSFLRLTSTSPGEMVMMYREIPIPQGVEALSLSFRHRLSNFKIGAKSWFDARVMMEFLDADRKKVAPSPPAPNFRKDTDGWQGKHVEFQVPAGAKTLKFMPSLLNVAAGQWDLDDVELVPVDPAPIKAAADAASAERQKKLSENAAKRRAKAAEQLAQNGSLIRNGNFEEDANGDGWPDNWGGKTDSASWGDEEGNRFMSLTSTTPDKMVMLYLQYDVPAGVDALEMTWRQRVSGLKVGEKPWFDARFLFEFKDADGKKVQGSPAPSYTQRNSNGWTEKSTRFLVPSEAVTLVVMPSLFQVKAGTLDFDDVSIKATDAAPILAAKKEAEEIAKARFVPVEQPDKAKWPAMLKVVGNKLVDANGKDVWLQGLNAGGLETLPHDKQVVKSVVVAIDEWKSNCIRLPVNEVFWYGHSPYQEDGGRSYRELVDQIVTLTANRGAYLVIDLHRFRAPKQEHADFWKDIAKQYANHPAVLFDLFNEPHDISWEIWRNGGFVGTRKDADQSAFLSEEEKRKNTGFESIGMQALVDAVRSAGANNIVIAGGIFWANDLTGISNGYALDDPSGNGIMYSWHTYHWHPGWARILPVAEKHPIFLGEVGAEVKGVMNFIPEADQEDPYTFVPDMLGFIQKYKIHWTGWCFHPKAAPRMLLDWKYTPTPYWGEFAKDALSGKQFEMKRMR